jgi:hypothetical protein
MARPKKDPSKVKTKQIKIYLTEREKQIFDSRCLLLFSSSPALRPADIFRKVALNIDDVALIQFLELRFDHPIKLKLRSDYLFSQL